MLEEQGMNVVCCTISMFDSVRQWNRENIKHIFYESKANAFPVFLIFQKSMLLSTNKEREDF